MTVVARESKSIAKKDSITAGRLQLESVNVSSATIIRLMLMKHRMRNAREMAAEACRSSRAGVEEEEEEEEAKLDVDVVASASDLEMYRPTSAPS